MWQKKRMLLTMREKTRIEAVQAVMDGRLAVAEAAIALKLSERQLYRASAAAREQVSPAPYRATAGARLGTGPDSEAVSTN
jgi:hypothetical protein